MKPPSKKNEPIQPRDFLQFFDPICVRSTIPPVIQVVTEIQKYLLIFSNGQNVPSKTESTMRVEYLDKNGLMQYQTNGKHRSTHEFINVLGKH